MKKIIGIVALMLVMHSGFAQIMQASIGTGSGSNRIRIYLRADVTQNAVISTLQFNVALPNTISPAPTLSVITNNIAGVTSWIVDPAVNEAGYLHYNIYTASAGYNLSVTANVEFQAMELAFTGGPPGSFANTAHLVTLPDGGSLNTHLFYCTGTINSNGIGGLYWQRDANVFISNGHSYRPGEPGSPQNHETSLARLIPAITLPVSFASYDVKCNDKGALVTWSTSSEQNSSKFEIQRSANGIDWKTVGTVSAAGNSNDTRNYQYLDISGGGTAQYRVRQVDIDGQFVYTAVRLTNCRSAALFDVVLYPVPANDKLNVVVKSDMDVATELRIVDMSGRVVKQIYSQINKGSTNITVPVHNLANGQYVLVSADPAVNISSKFVIAH